MASDGEVAEEADDTGVNRCTIDSCLAHPFATKKELNQHIVRKHKLKLHPCVVPDCDEAYTSAEGLSKHVALVHQQRDVQCPQCPRLLIDQEGLKNHLKLHRARPFQCSKSCTEMFVSQTELNTHEANCRPREWVKEPMVDKDKPYRCVVCGKRYNSHSNIYMHIVADHHPKSVSCTEPECRNLPPFKHQESLNGHIRRKHKSAGKDFKCSKCDKSFTTKGSADRHQKTCKVIPKTTVPLTPATAKRTGQPGPQQGTFMASMETSEIQQCTKDNIAESEELRTGLPTPGEIFTMTEKDEPDEQPRSMRALLGEAIHDKYKTRIECIGSVLGRSFYSETVETPSPTIRVVLGRNLQKFHDAQHVDSMAAISNPVAGQPSINLQTFMQGDGYRKLYATHKKASDEGYLWITIANYRGKRTMPHHEEVKVEVAELNLNEDSMKAYASTLRRVYEHIPTFLYLLSDKQKAWAQRAAYKLVFDLNVNLKLQIKCPRMHSSYILLKINGYDPAKNEGWYEEFNVPIGKINLKMKITIPFEDRVSFIDDSLNPVIEQKSRYHRSDKEAALSLAKRLAVQFYGFIGPSETCGKEILDIITRHWGQGSTNTSRVNLPKPYTSQKGQRWVNQSFFTSQAASSHRTVLSPTSFTTDNMTGGYTNIVILGDTNEKCFPVINAMLLALRDGHDCDTVWGIGAARADIENENFGHEVPIASCSITEPKHAKELDVCPNCLQLVPHEALQQIPSFQPFATCLKCKAHFDSVVADGKVAGGAVGYHLYQHLLKENKHNGSNKSSELIKTEQRTIWEDLKQFKLNETSFKDGYIDQILNVDGARDTAWDGSRLNPKFPSIEAVDPVVEGLDGKTGYHVRGNLIIVSDAINRAKKHYPALVLECVFLLRKGVEEKNQQLYETGISMNRILLVNHYVYGDLGHVQQTKRIGNVLPTNWKPIVSSFRKPLLLELDRKKVADERIYRFLATRQAISPEQRSAWIHPNHKWLQLQLIMVAQRVFGMNYQQYQHLWLRRARSGLMVFFPFSTKYSRVDDWTEWDLFEFLIVRAIRNVTECQAPHSKTNPIRQYSSEELFLVVVNLWLRQLQKDIAGGIPEWACGMDEAGLVVQPNINSLQCASLGHRWPGKEENLALDNFDLSSPREVIFSPDACGMKWETQFCNFLQFKYSWTSLNAKVFAQLRRLHLDNYVQYNPDSDGHLALDLVPDPFKDAIGISTYMVDTERASSTSIEQLRPYAAFVTGGGTQLVQAEPVQVAKDFSKVKLAEALIPTRKQLAVRSIFDPAPEIDDPFDVPDVPIQISDEELIKISGDPMELSDDPFEVSDDPFDESDVEMISELSYPHNIRNMSNLGRSCYAGVIFQLFAHIPELSDILKYIHNFQPKTGRSPNILSASGDPTGAIHKSLFSTLATLVFQLRKPGSQLSVVDSERPFQDFGAFRGCIYLPNQDESPNSLFDWLMDKLNTVTDGSVHIQKPEIWVMRDVDQTYHRRNAYSPEEVLDLDYAANVSDGEKLPTLSLHAAEHWIAHLASGYDSPATACLTIQHVDLSQCESETCEHIKHNFHYSEQMELKIANVLIDEDKAYSSIRFDDLVRANFEEFDHSGRLCRGREHKQDGCKSRKYCKQVRRITRAPPIFVVEINRTSVQTVNPTSGEEERPHLQRIEGYQSFNMTDLSNDGPAVVEKINNNQIVASHERLEGDNLNSVYECIAIVAYHDVKRHYINFVKLEPQGWVCFDDMKSRPEFNNPVSHWPNGYVETMIVFRSEHRELNTIGWKPALNVDVHVEPGNSKEVSQQIEIVKLQKEILLLKEKSVSHRQQPLAAIMPSLAAEPTALVKRLSGYLSSSSSTADKQALMAHVQNVLDVHSTNITGTSTTITIPDRSSFRQASTNTPATGSVLPVGASSSPFGVPDPSIQTKSPGSRREKVASTVRNVTNFARRKSNDWMKQMGGNKTDSDVTSVRRTLGYSFVNASQLSIQQSTSPVASTPPRLVATAPTLRQPTSIKRRISPSATSTGSKRSRSGATDPAQFMDVGFAAPVIDESPLGRLPYVQKNVSSMTLPVSTPTKSGLGRSVSKPTIARKSFDALRVVTREAKKNSDQKNGKDQSKKYEKKDSSSK